MLLLPDEFAAQIYDDVLKAADAIEARRPLPKEAFELLTPYRDLDVIDGVPEERSRRLLHLVACILGDAYRESGAFAEAAHWYRRASEFQVLGGYYQYYAELVIDHHFTEHYEHALWCLREVTNAWKRTPLILRALSQILAFKRRIMRPWSIRPYRALQKRAKTFEATLISRLAATPASTTV